MFSNQTHILESVAVLVVLFVSDYRVTVAWCVRRRGAKKKESATFSRAALTVRCLAGQYVNSLRSDMLRPCSV